MIRAGVVSIEIDVSNTAITIINVIDDKRNAVCANDWSAF